MDVDRRADNLCFSPCLLSLLTNGMYERELGNFEVVNGSDVDGSGY